MSKKRKAGGFRRKQVTGPTRRTWHAHGQDCGCSGMVVRACDGVCESCGAADSKTFPPMPSSQGMGEVSEVGWSCPSCGDGEVVGRGVVVEVVR